MPELRALIDALDAHGARCVRALGELNVAGDEDAYRRNTTALLAALAMRLVAFGLGPVGAIHPRLVDQTTSDFLAVLNDLQADHMGNDNGTPN